jgi:hypothetical protein
MQLNLIQSSKAELSVLSALALPVSADGAIAPSSNASAQDETPSMLPG